MSTMIPRVWSADVPTMLIGQRSESGSPVTADFDLIDLTWAKLQLHAPHPDPITAHLPSSPAPRADAMASRQLALNLQRSMRSRAAINAVKSSKMSPLTRGLATPVTHGSKTESTTLSNGFTVCRPRQDLWRLQLTRLRRSLPSTPRGPRRRPSVCGSMLEAVPRRTRPTEPHTSSSTLPSRFAAPQ